MPAATGQGSLWQKLARWLDALFLLALALTTLLLDFSRLPSPTLKLLRLLLLLYLGTIFALTRLPLIFLTSLKELLLASHGRQRVWRIRRSVFLKTPFFALTALFIFYTFQPHSLRRLRGQEATPSASLESEATPSASLAPEATPSATLAEILLEASPSAEVKALVAQKKPTLLKRHFRAQEGVAVFIGGHRLGDLKVEVLSSASGKRVDAPTRIEGEILKIEPKGSFRPGKYHLKVTSSEGTVLEEDFTWGVLAINTNKSIFLPGEKVYLQMAVLDEYGHTICNASLKLEIKNPQSETAVFTTQDGTIKSSDTCGSDNVTDNPDYFANYQVNQTGTYQLRLTNLDNKYEVSDSFEVKESLPFEIERLGATRINPYKANYVMRIKVKAGQDFSGEIVETVPESFDIKDKTLNIKTTDQKSKKIIWQVDWTTGESYELEYEYDAPDDSPQLYLLGPLTIQPFDHSAIVFEESRPASNIIFGEARQWQVAADATCTSAATGNWNATGTWTGCTGGNGTTPNTPGSADTAIITATHNVTVTVSETVSALQFGSASTTGTVTVNSGITLTVTNAVTLLGNVAAGTAGTIQNGTGAGTITAASITVGSTGTTTLNAATTLTNFTSTISTFTVNGAINTNCQTNGVGNRKNTTTINLSSGSMSVSSTITLCSTGMGAQFKMTGGSQNATLTTSAATPWATITSPATATLNGTTATVAYSGANQAILVTTYTNLTLSGSGTATGAVTTVSGDFVMSNTVSYATAANFAVTGNATIGTNTTFTAPAFTLTVTGTTSVTGTLTISSATGTKAFNGDLTVNLNGTFNNTEANASLTLPGSLTNNGTFNPGTGTYTLSGASKTISGTFANAFTAITISGASLSNSGTFTTATLTVDNTFSNTGTITVTTTLTGSSTFTNGDGSSGTLNFGGASIGVTTFTASAANNTVNYNSSSAEQTVRNVVYYNLSAITTSARILKFTSSVTTTITNALTLTGTTGPTYLTLAPSIADTVWTIDPPPSSVSVDYVSVSYSTATECINATNSFNGGNNTLWAYSGEGCNQNPSFDDPPALAQKKTTDVVLAVGDWTNEVGLEVKFTANAEDLDASDTLYLCVEKKAIETAFTGPEDGCSSPGISYVGTPVEVTVTIAGVTDTEYHWRARVKDAASAYSAWVAYGDNPVGDGTTDGSPANRDYGIDISDPTLGDVYDGTEAGVDTDFSTTSLSQLSANWANFDATVSGLNKYQYSIGTTQGGTDTKAWTDNSTTTSVTATGLTLQTSQVYYFNVRAVDNAGNTQDPVISSDGQVITPSLSFSVSPSTLPFANLNEVNSYTDTEDATLTTSTNAYNGYVVRAFITDYPRSTDTLYTIIDFNGGSYASPDGWLSTNRGFGYTSSDTDVQGSNKFGSTPCAGGNSPPCYAPFNHTGPGDIVADHTATVTGSPITNEQFTITCKVMADNTKEAANYVTTIVYTITAQY